MTPVRRLDHVAIAVRNTEGALGYFRDRLGLRVAHTEELERPAVQLTYLDVGNAYLQLIEPLDSEGELANWLAEHGEGLHHVCFGVDDPLGAAEELALDGVGPPVPGTGRGRASAFTPGELAHGVRIECTEFRREADVEQTSGWLGD